MKRFPELRQLSEDHHHALVLARRTRAAEDDASASKMWQEVEEKFRLELNPHFIIEEKFLAPHIEALGEQELIKRFRSDHKELRALVNDRAAWSLTSLKAFGKVLEAHVRFEERKFFEVAQKRLPIAILKAVEQAAAG